MYAEVLIYVERSGNNSFNVALLYSNGEDDFDGIEFVGWKKALDAANICRSTYLSPTYTFSSKVTYFNLKEQEYVDCDDIFEKYSVAISGAWNLSEDELYDFVNYIVEGAKSSSLGVNVKIGFEGSERYVYNKDYSHQPSLSMILVALRIVKFA